MNTLISYGFRVMNTNSRVDARLDVSAQTDERTDEGTNGRKLARLYRAAKAGATKSNHPDFKLYSSKLTYKKLCLYGAILMAF